MIDSKTPRGTTVYVAHPWGGLFQAVFHYLDKDGYVHLRTPGNLPAPPARPAECFTDRDEAIETRRLQLHAAVVEAMAAYESFVKTRNNNPDKLFRELS